MSTTELTEQPLAYKIIELTVVLVVYCLKFLSLMQDDFVEGASEKRLKSQCFDTGFNRVENIRRQCNAVDWTSNTISEIFP